MGQSFNELHFMNSLIRVLFEQSLTWFMCRIVYHKHIHLFMHSMFRTPSVRSNSSCLHTCHRLRLLLFVSAGFVFVLSFSGFSAAALALAHCVTRLLRKAQGQLPSKEGSSCDCLEPFAESGRRAYIDFNGFAFQGCLRGVWFLLCR